MKQAASTNLLPNTVNESEIAVGVDDRLVLWHFLASFVFLIFAMLVGLLYSFQFLQLYPGMGIELLSPGRWRMVHTNTAILGFIANAFLGALYWVIPRLTQQKVLSAKLSWAIFAIWQFVVLSTVAGLVTGHAQAVRWGESPAWIDPVMLAGLVFVGINFAFAVFRISGPVHVSLWYFFAAFAWTLMFHVIGSYFPHCFMGLDASGRIVGLFVDDLTGLCLVPLGFGLIYYFVPIICQQPLWNHALALLGFWCLACFYPLSLVGDFLDHPIPGWVRMGVVVAKAAVMLAIVIVVMGLLGTLRGRSDKTRGGVAIHWCYLGTVLFLIMCGHRITQSIFAFGSSVPFTDWGVAQAHLAMFGVLGFWIFAIMVHLMPRLLGAADWFRTSWNRWHFWLTSISLLVMYVGLTLAGLLQGALSGDLAPWETVLSASKPYWALRSIAGAGMIVGQLFFAINIAMTWVHRATPLGATRESSS